MTVLNDGNLVPDESNLLRLPRPPREFNPDGWRPDHKQFEPSSEDKRHAERFGKPVRVSVWDAGVTMVAQARAVQPNDVVVLRLANSDVREIAASCKNERRRTVYDPLDFPESTWPGADGHAGIEGLDRIPGAPRARWSAMLDDLASMAHLA